MWSERQTVLMFRVRLTSGQWLCGSQMSALHHRWILALKASVKKWLPLHQALQDYMDQPPEETRM